MASLDGNDDLTWLERVWIETADEIAYETAHPQDPDPSDCSCFGSDQGCARCGIPALNTPRTPPA